jgi:hypothetical protein
VFSLKHSEIKVDRLLLFTESPREEKEGEEKAEREMKKEDMQGRHVCTPTKIEPECKRRRLQTNNNNNNYFSKYRRSIAPDRLTYVSHVAICIFFIGIFEVDLVMNTSRIHWQFLLIPLVGMYLGYHSMHPSCYVMKMPLCFMGVCSLVLCTIYIMMEMDKDSTSDQYKSFFFSCSALCVSMYTVMHGVNGDTFDVMVWIMVVNVMECALMMLYLREASMVWGLTILYTLVMYDPPFLEQ